MTSAHATARRAELFDQLVALLLSEGFAHLTLDEIAARLRCSKSTLYTLAGSKEQLDKIAKDYAAYYSSYARQPCTSSAAPPSESRRP